MVKQYLVLETKRIAIFKDKKEAQANIDNMSLWYPENGYEIIEQEVE